MITGFFMSKMRLVDSEFVESLIQEINELFLENAYLRLTDKQREIDCLKQDLNDVRKQRDRLNDGLHHLLGELDRQWS